MQCLQVSSITMKSSFKPREAAALGISSSSALQAYPSVQSINSRLTKIYSTQQISDKVVSSTTHSDESDKDNDLNGSLTNEYSLSSTSSSLSSIRTVSSTSTSSLYSFGRRNSDTSQSQMSSRDDCDANEHSDVQQHFRGDNSSILQASNDENDADNAYSDENDKESNEDDNYSNRNERAISFRNDAIIIDKEHIMNVECEALERLDSSKENQKFRQQIRKPFRLYQNTKPLAEIRNTEGLLSIAIKTIKLVKRNQLLQQRLNQLQMETSEFIQSVLNNPENRHFREKIQQKVANIENA
uniref:Uncharacterized protein n=1 Tax=Glossina palpalis gambiensis TaxID=67801 RepID=A0A1B0BP28_9MUSC